MAHCPHACMVPAMRHPWVALAWLMSGFLRCNCGIMRQWVGRWGLQLATANESDVSRYSAAPHSHGTNHFGLPQLLKPIFCLFRPHSDWSHWSITLTAVVPLLGIRRQQRNVWDVFCLEKKKLRPGDKRCLIYFLFADWTAISF